MCQVMEMTQLCGGEVWQGRQLLATSSLAAAGTAMDEARKHGSAKNSCSGPTISWAGTSAHAMYLTGGVFILCQSGAWTFENY